MGYTHFSGVDATLLKINGTQLTATAAELNAMSGESGFLDGAVAGTQTAGKCVVADSNVNTGVSKVTELHVGATGSEVQITATPAELNLADASAQTETITVAGAVSVTSRVTNLDATSGAYAVTLAAPDASMLGQVKVINMTVAGNAITLALTEVQGQSAGTGASFDAVDETLVLVAGVNKWTVVGEAGVTLA